LERPTPRALLASLALLLVACGDGVVSDTSAESDPGDPSATTSSGTTGPGSSAATGGTGGSSAMPSSGGSGSAMTMGGAGSAPTVITPGRGKAAQVAAKLGRTAHFLVGLGNHANDDYAVPSLDLNYVYLVGFVGQNGWPDWDKPSGAYLTQFASAAQQHHVVPFFTVYGMAGWGDGNIWAVQDHGYMQSYWSTAKLMFQKIAEYGGPAVVHFEPDFWGYTQSQEPDPSKFQAKVTAEAPDCAALTDNMVGMGKCLVKLARMYAPKAVIGFQASSWAGKPEDIVSYLAQIGAGTTDMVVVETLDRDAGCFEVGSDTACKRKVDNPYWDDQGFRDHLAWAKQIGDGLGVPLVWWQMPLGVPSTSPGGSSGHYRDNRASWLFSHPGEFVAAGGLGAVFGAGADHQTTLSTDNGQFVKLAGAYAGAPAQLP
jgi:hypothetical protein